VLVGFGFRVAGLQSWGGGGFPARSIRRVLRPGSGAHRWH